MAPVRRPFYGSKGDVKRFSPVQCSQRTKRKLQMALTLANVCKYLRKKPLPPQLETICITLMAFTAARNCPTTVDEYRMAVHWWLFPIHCSSHVHTRCYNPSHSDYTESRPRTGESQEEALVAAEPWASGPSHRGSSVSGQWTVRTMLLRWTVGGGYYATLSNMGWSGGRERVETQTVVTRQL